MARHSFGQTPADWAFTTNPDGIPILAGGVTVTFWSQPIGGVQYTDLLDGAGAAAAAIVTADGTSLPVGTIPRFQGPDGITSLWADAGGGTRYLMVATDLGGYITDLRSTVTDLQELVALLSNSAGVIRYDTTTSSWPARPTDSRTYFWVGPTAPTVGGTGMVDGVDLWINPAPVS